MLTVDTIPLRRTDAGMERRGDTEKRQLRRVAASPNLRVSPSLRFLVTSVLSATTTELLKFQTLSRCFLIFSRRVVPTLALTTLKNNVIARHNQTSLLLSLHFVPGTLYFRSLVFRTDMRPSLPKLFSNLNRMLLPGNRSLSLIPSRVERADIHRCSVFGLRPRPCAERCSRLLPTRSAKRED